MNSFRRWLNTRSRAVISFSLLVICFQIVFWWVPASTHPVVATIPVTIVQIRGHSPQWCMSIADGRRAVMQASDYWKQYGVAFKIVGTRVIDNCEQATISSGAHRRGEINLIIKALATETGTMVVALPERFTNLDGSWAPEVAGLTSLGHDGFAIVISDWRVTAHEIGHVLLGCYHARFQPGNIMQQGLSDSDKVPWVSIWQSYRARTFARGFK